MFFKYRVYKNIKVSNVKVLIKNVYNYLMKKDWAATVQIVTDAVRLPFVHGIFCLLTFRWQNFHSRDKVRTPLTRTILKEDSTCQFDHGNENWKAILYNVNDMRSLIFFDIFASNMKTFLSVLLSLGKIFQTILLFSISQSNDSLFDLSCSRSCYVEYDFSRMFRSRSPVDKGINRNRPQTI